MRFQDFKTTLNELNMMTSRVINTGGSGKYRNVLIQGIENDVEFNWVIDKEETSGVIQNKDEVLAQLPKSQDPGKIKVQVKTADGAIVDVRLSAMIKDEVSKGALQVNMGNIAEAVLGCAMTAKFAKDGKDVTTADIIKIGKELAKNGTYKTVTPSRDELQFNITISRTDTKAFNAYMLDGPQGLKDLDVDDEKIKTFQEHIKDAVEFVNTSPRAKAAVEKAKADPRENKVDVLSDGGNAEKQKSTKVDLEITMNTGPNGEPERLNLISLKAGSVKQFGQESGGEFATLERFFKSVVGFGLPKSMESDFKSATDPEYKMYNYTNIWPKAYQHIYNELKPYTTGDNTRKEFDLVKQIYDGIRYHATRHEEGVTLVILSPNKKKAFYELGFGKELMTALEQYDLEVVLKTDVKNPMIEIYGIAKTDTARKISNKSRLVAMRSSMNRGAVRNVIEMGDLLKDLADLEKLDKQTADKPKPKATVEPQQPVKAPTKAVAKKAGPNATL
jgi:hypothetical protein